MNKGLSSGEAEYTVTLNCTRAQTQKPSSNITSTSVISLHSTLEGSTHYEYARLQQQHTVVLPPMFYLMRPPLVDSMCTCLLQNRTASPLMPAHSPNNGTFSIHFSLDLSVSLREWKHHDSIFIRGGFWIGSFCGHFCNKAGGFCRLK